MRWGIEIEFRGLKQTLERAKLRSRNDQRLLAELDWSIMAMAIVELFAWKEQLAEKTPTGTGRRPTPRNAVWPIRSEPCDMACEICTTFPNQAGICGLSLPPR